MRNHGSIARRWLVLDKLGAIGAILAAAAAPCCFPLLAVVGAALGLGAFQSMRGYMDYAIQAMVVLALIGDALAFRQHRRAAPLIMALVSAATVFFAYYIHYQVALIYAGLFGLTLAAVWNVVEKRRSVCCKRERMTPILETILTCPQCSARTIEKMPTDACVFFWDCPTCSAHLKPKPGDCCVFCSYGMVKCPPVQIDGVCRK